MLASRWLGIVGVWLLIGGCEPHCPDSGVQCVADFNLSERCAATSVCLVNGMACSAAAGCALGEVPGGSEWTVITLPLGGLGVPVSSLPDVAVQTADPAAEVVVSFDGTSVLCVPFASGGGRTTCTAPRANPVELKIELLSRRSYSSEYTVTVGDHRCADGPTCGV